MTASPEHKRSSSVSSAGGSTQPIPKKSLQIRTDKPRPHLCGICTRGFARLEHLKRHERAHTNEKPYQCAVCGRCFARRDLVLRHQQKLHSNIFSVARRGSLPATLSQPAEPDAAGTPTNENVIILRNNTRAKAPLPDSFDLPYSDSVESTPHDSPPTNPPLDGFAENGGHMLNSVAALSKTAGVIPSPNTNSYHNTPSVSGMHGASSSFSDLEMLQNHNIVTDYTQQPSPLTGDSPDLKEKKSSKEKARQAFLNDQLEFKSSLDLKTLHLQGKPHLSTTRHASFSAVPGLSYTNLQDALTIRNHHMPPGHVPAPTHFTQSDLDLHALSVPDLNANLHTDLHEGDLDWCNFNFTDAPRVSPHVTADSLATSDGSGKQKMGSGFKMSLNTIPSESHLAAAFLAETPHINHQFQNPNHPHHIPGTIPMDFDFPIEDPLQGGDINMSGNINEDVHGDVQDNISKINYGTGFTQLTQDILFLSEHEAQSAPAPSDGPENQGNAKRRKIGFANDIDDLSWLEQFKGIPLASELPCASTNTGFQGMPFVKDEFQSDEVFSLFKMKQDDLVRQKSRVDLAEAEKSAVTRASRAQFTIGEPSEFITEELRARIVEASNVADDHFPPRADLNAYMDLYGAEFNTYFSFIHLPTLKSPIVDNFENIPMILAMCSIGALYSYHDSNTLLLFNLSKYHIHRFFENEVTPNKLQSKKVPIMAHQCLVLHIFISMFLNEPNMVEITSRQLKSMVGLIRTTNFHNRCEQYLVPPPAITNANDRTNVQNNFGYFIMAQTRIRTILTFYELEVVRSILLGCELPMKGSEIKSGIHSSDEELWRAANASEWHAHFAHHENETLVEVSNNSDNQSLSELAQQLNGGQLTDPRNTLDKSLALLMYVHEQISTSSSQMAEFDPFSWRVDHMPKLQYLLLSWEEYFVRNGGSIIINNQNESLLNSKPQLKLILPLHLLAKIRLCVNFAPVTTAVLHRDWSGLSASLGGLDSDIDGLKEASKHALSVLDLWTHNLSVVDDAKQTSVRTPVFFLMAIFISVMILGKTLEAIENGKSLSVSERAFWLNCEKMLRSIETTLSSHEQSSYSEFLNRQSGGVFDFTQDKAFQKNVEAVRDSDKAMKVRSVKKCKLSTHTLGLGVRILADAPLWPLAMRFAEALKHMAMDTNNKT